MKDVKTVFHIYNIHHSPNIVQAAIDNNVERVILVHTTGIYSKYKSASLKYNQVESVVIDKAKGKLALTILRPSMIYGDMCDHNISKFIKIINKIKIVPLIDGGAGLIQPVNARDLGNAYYSVLMNPHRTANKQYDLTGEKPISIKEVLVSISNKLNKKIIFIPIPLTIGVLVARVLKLLTLRNIDLVEKVLRLAENRSYNHALAKNDFNFTPIPFEKGIEIEINEFKQMQNHESRVY